MNYHIDIQHASNDKIPISDELLCQWTTQALRPYRDHAELTIRLVDKNEITHLNTVYRKKNKATNVLAFPANYPKNIVLEYPLLGDVIICPDVLKQESVDLQTPLTAHWAHIVIHGVLHLLGYDHMKEEEAMVMQTIEKTILKELGFDDPYVERGYTD
jgi:probable rRNA maturation factor